MKWHETDICPQYHTQMHLVFGLKRVYVKHFLRYMLRLYRATYPWLIHVHYDKSVTIAI